MAANLDHPHIVPVFDVGSAAQCPCFVVSKFIDGCTLAHKIKEERPSVTDAIEIVAAIADALHYAHHKLVHRDVKPGNILLDAAGKPYLTDFGLALKEENVGQGPRYVGTPAYMSPEQARGEGHRLDGRSDIFSLGIVFYEMLAGRRPFQADTRAEVLEQIMTFEPRPLRQFNEEVPRELERICFKALSKRAAERYMTANDMAEDLRHFFSQQTVAEQSRALRRKSNTPPLDLAAPGAAKLAFDGSGVSAILYSHIQQVKVVPKGLRSFDEHDADFFLELLPGPRDREGLPESIRFWKTRIEETDPDDTFSVGLIYGPSGCGKSSLVKAGLLPRLSDDVLAVYLQATAKDTESRLVNTLHKRFPALPANLGLKETLAVLRREQGITRDKKVLIVLDQLEQWLHARRGDEESDLVQALRQCDGGRVQCLILVRDDFWMAATRFMRDLEIDLVPGQNVAAVDLFDPRHAKRVLTSFGQSFGALPEPPAEPTKEQKAFIERAITGLTQEGKIICVRLAMFAEMMKGKPWTTASLKEDVGVMFLDETFSSPAANPKHRLHQVAARAVLKALLPESGTDIKGHGRSATELLVASGYVGRPNDFDVLLQILANELCLITPTDPEGNERNDSSDAQSPPEQIRYQLTHDYLVQSLRDWLTRKQKETRRGRAELLLADRASIWNVRPESRQLPSFPQWVNIHLLTQKSNWTEPEQKMMNKADRYYAVRVLGCAIILVLAGWGGYEAVGTVKAHNLRDRLLTADMTNVKSIVDDMTPYRPWIDPLLWTALQDAKAGGDPGKHLLASLALLPVDSSQKEYLYTRLLNADPREVGVLLEALLPHAPELRGRLWDIVEQPSGRERERLRAACALAKYDKDSPRWAKVIDAIAQDVVEEPAVYLATWVEFLRPVALRLFDPLAAIFRDTKNHRESERSLAVAILADYIAVRPGALADLLMDADDNGFLVLFRKLQEQGHSSLAVLDAELARRLSEDATQDAKVALAKRQANAAVALLRMGRATRVWPFFEHSSDPTLRSYLIHRLGPLGVDANIVLEQLKKERNNLSIRRALILSLGEFSEKELASSERQSLVKELRELYRNTSDPGLHAAVEWLLRQWSEDKWLKQTEIDWAKDERSSKDRLDDIRRQLASRPRPAPGEAQKPLWYVDGLGQTMVVIAGPTEFLMGAPKTETEKLPDDQSQHRQVIDHTFAIAAKSVTLEQFLRYPKAKSYLPRPEPAPDCPVNWITWNMVPEFCNWLSKREGLPEQEWCYLTNPDGKSQGALKLAPDYLRRIGYRLPTEAEWECACRAGALTSRYYGESIDLLKNYAWYVSNSDYRTRPVGSLKPNDWGLFDMHGNVWTWCHEDGAKVADTELHAIIRGGAFVDAPAEVRAACRFTINPERITTYVGLRLARTIRPAR